MRRFSLYKRNSVFYARFWNSETGSYTSGISTGQSEKTLADMVASRWILDGIPEKGSIKKILNFDTLLFYLRETELDTLQAERVITILTDRGLLSTQSEKSKVTDLSLHDFLSEFWDYDQSQYVKEKLAYGHSIGRRHCLDMQCRLKHWLAFFGNKKQIKEITRDSIQEFQFYLKKKLAPKTVNLVVSVGAVAFGWLLEKKYILDNPTQGLKKFSGTVKKRGILTPGQVKKLFSVSWDDERCRVGSLIAMTCGLRLGEVLALRPEDIGSDRLYIRHSFSFTDGLKKPKNNEARTVPLLPAVRKEIVKLIESNPWGKDGFIFYGADLKNKPMRPETMKNGFTKTLEKIGMTNTERMKQNIVFHSWRHFFAANIAGRVELKTLQLGIGHKTSAMTEHYADHENEERFSTLSTALDDAFKNIVPFAKEA